MMIGMICVSDSVELESGFKSDFVSIKCNFEYANIHSSSAHKYNILDLNATSRKNAS